MEDLRIELDLEQTREFQRLFALLGGNKEKTLFWVWRLYCDLGYLAKSGGRLGFLPEGDVELYTTAIGEVTDSEAAIQKLRESKWLMPEEGGYLCVRFMNVNAHLSFGGSERAQRALGGRMKGFRSQMSKIEANLAGQTMLIPETLFVRPDSQPMEPEEVRRVTLIIKGVDTALGLPDRQRWQYNEGLVQSAYKVNLQMSDEQISTALNLIVRKRGHPALPRVTEQVIPMLPELPGKLA
jgi:hypothetical protein